MADGNVLTDAIKAELKNIGDKVKAQGEAVQAEVKRLGEMTDGTRATVDELLNKNGELHARMTNAEQLMAKLEGNGAGGDVQHDPIGGQVVANADFQTFAKSGDRGRFSLTFDTSINAAITTTTGTADGNAGSAIAPNRLPGIVTPPQRQLRMRDLIAPGSTDTGIIQYVKESGFTNNAAPTAEGAQKPESSLKYTRVDTTTKVIAHWFQASKQVLSDFPQLASIIQARGIYGLKLKEDYQILNGDGTGENLLGIIGQASAYAAPGGITAEDPTMLDQLRFAMLQVALAEYPASGAVMHPIDVARAEVIKDSTGRYIVGNPAANAGVKTLWGLPLVETVAIAQDKFLVGAFDIGAQLFDQWKVRVEISTEDRDNFIKNMVTILIEERLGLAVYRPEAFVYGDLGFLA